MSKIITDDPMIQQAAMAEQQQQQAYMMIKQIELSLMISSFTQFAVNHSESGENLTLEIGRAMAAESRAISNQYIGFLLENMGLAKMEVSKIETLSQEDVDK